MSKANILVIDDDKDILVASEVLLENEGFNCFCIQHPENSKKILKSKDISVILLDMNYLKGNTDGHEGIHWLDFFLKEYPEIVVIPITAYVDVELAVNAVKKGAFDFLLKPWDNRKLISIIYSALQLSKSLKDTSRLKQIQSYFKTDPNTKTIDILGESKEIKRVLDAIDKVSGTEANVIITGDSGTGKDLVAKQIHNKSKRRDEIFFKLDLASIHVSLFESEIFGYEKGAFTDAKESKPGKIEIANGGSLFLDEITSLDLSQQSKLLSLLQNRKITRIGSLIEKDIDIRLISSTNKPIKELIKSGLFREDLYFRLNTFEIHVPRLCERIEDIPLLANFYIEKFAKQYEKPNLKINSRILNAFTNYSWPGNVRELINIIERAVILSDGKTLDLKNILLSEKQIKSINNSSLNIANTEVNLILKAIEKNDRNMTLAAKELGLTRSSFYRRLEKYGIK
ncbi:MAG: sigma-54-dependent Fis family transcriptional regulator [Bacteroidales bacterium]|nr:sigma-54-dependent Fis family transcriptional regulator [Bacteroidales bacterium]